MPQARVLLGTEVVMDFMNERQPFYQQTRMLMVAGRVGEFDLWVTAPQVVDLVYLPVSYTHLRRAGSRCRWAHRRVARFWARRRNPAGQVRD